MPLEAGTFISDLTPTNPGSGDVVSQGDDHLRLLKTVLKNTFPNADKAFYLPVTESKSIDFSISAADLNKTFLVDTTSTEITGTLPPLTTDDDGWTCHFIKTNTDLNAFFIEPDSGTLQSGEVSGLAQCRRVIPGQRCSAIWSGTAWFVTRVPTAPIGSVLDFCGASLPVGYEIPNGQVLASASTKYPEFYAVNGNSGVTVDITGRVVAGKEASATRLTSGAGGIDGATLGAVGGTQTHTLTIAQLAVHTHVVTDPGHIHAITDPGHFHTYNTAQGAGSNSSTNGADGSTPNTSTSTTGISINSHTTGITNQNEGSGAAHPNTQPTIILNKILVVE